jgi:mannose-6-phosphate isomerase-like protein (cupin superfamily)
MHLTPSLESARSDEVPLHRVEKGWGHELWIVNKDYCGKLLHFRRGKKCSWHYHIVKDEVFFLQSGRLLVRFGPGDDLRSASSVLLLPGMAFSVPPGLRHQMDAEEDSHLFEFSTHHEDEDSIRVVKGD